MAQDGPLWLRPEAERLVDQGCFPALRKYFPTLEDAFSFYAARQEERFAIVQVGTACCRCGKAEFDRVVQATWDYQFPSVTATVGETLAKLIHPHVHQHRHSSFVTYHRLCEPCWKSQSRLMLVGTAVRYVGSLGVAAGLLVGLISTSLYFGSPGRPSEQRWLAVVIGIAAAAGLAGLFLDRLGHRWRVPAALRHVARRPIDLIQLDRYRLEPYDTTIAAPGAVAEESSHPPGATPSRAGPATL